MTSSGMCGSESSEILVAPAFANFASLSERATKVDLNTCLPTARKNFELRDFRTIIKKIKYPGVALHYARDFGARPLPNAGSEPKRFMLANEDALHLFSKYPEEEAAQ